MDRSRPSFFCSALSFVFAICFLNVQAVAQQFQAGIYAQDITPKNLPVWVNGNIAAVKADKVNDPLHARCLVLGDGKTKIAICVVDSCIIPLELTEAARQKTTEATGIPPENILISSTHTHSAVSVAGAHGCPVQEDYAAELPNWIAEGIAKADKAIVPARIGTTKVVCDKYIYCRRWLMKPGTGTTIPFTGRTENQVDMNPGYENPNRLYQVGPIDTLIPVLSIQTMDGKPLSVLASFSTHYAGAPALSADYFAVVCQHLAAQLRPDDPKQFLGLMANATSGDANCIDFSKPSEPFTYMQVGKYVADKILSVLPQTEYKSDVTLDAIMETLTIDARVPNMDEVKEAKHYIETHFPDRLPTSMIENYARETVLLSEMPKTRELKLQVLRIGDFAIVANPCESYGATGLKLRQASPFALTMNIGLANGHAGYIPPPEHFQLGGYTTWRARSSCLEEFAEPKMVQGLIDIMKRLYAKPVVTSSRKPPSSPIHAQESLKWIELEKGYEASLVASEPAVVDPVAIQIDDAGRIWVVEMRDYPNGPKNPSDPPMGRVVVLQDVDGDGHFETSSIFADQLRFPTGIQLWKSGAVVTAAGELLYFEDKDHDLKADGRRVMLEGFTPENPQLRANHPTLSLDGQFYVANGLRGGKIRAPQHAASSKKSGELDLAGNDLRFNYYETGLQGVTGPSQFGLTFDSMGRRYGCANRQPCLEAMVEQSQLKLSPLAGLVPAVMDVSPSEVASSVRPLVRAWTTSNLHAGQFTAACGVLVTESSQLTKERELGNVLTCEPTGSLVQRRSIDRIGGRTQVIDKAPEKEWFASHDPWCRPVNLYEGPGGVILVVDMYRAVIEHPDWVPKELKQRPDERYGDAHGRLYAVSLNTKLYRDHLNALRSSPLSKRKTEELIMLLDAPDAWTRSTVARLILERFAFAEAAEGYDNNMALLLKACNRFASWQGRIAALHLSFAVGKSEPNFFNEVGSCVKDTDPRVQFAFWKLVEEHELTKVDMKNVDPRLLIGYVLEGLKSNDVDVVRAAAWNLGKMVSDWESKMQPYKTLIVESTAPKILNYFDDGHTWMALAAANSKNLTEFLVHISMKLDSIRPEAAESDIPWQGISKLAGVIQTNTPERSAELSKLIAPWLESRKPNRIQSLFAIAVLEGLTRPLRGPGYQPIPSEWAWIESLARRETAANAPLSDVALRKRALRLMVHASSPKKLEIVLPILEAGDSTWIPVALEALGTEPDTKITDWCLSQLKSASPSLRNEIMRTLKGEPSRLLGLVKGIESGDVSLKWFDAAQLQSLAAIQDKELQPRIAKLLANLVNKDREKVIEQYQPALSLTPNAERGKSIFEKNCASCHRIDQTGFSVGPDISDSREQSFEKLLVSILDPNRTIDNNYFRYTAVREDGEIVDGILREATANTVTLRGQNGKEFLLQRSEISELKSTGVSMMPEGVEAQIAPQDMADLLSYIKNWRYLDGSVPRGISGR